MKKTLKSLGGRKIAQTKNLIVTSLQQNGDKSFIRIGDTSPESTHTNSSAIQFLQDAQSTFLTSGTQSAFRIRHNSQDSQLVFQVSNNSGNTFSAITIGDQGNVGINGILTFQDAQFDQITTSHLLVNSSSRFIQNVQIFSKYDYGLYRNKIFLNERGIKLTKILTDVSPYPSTSVALENMSVGGGLKLSYESDGLGLYPQPEIMLYVQGGVSASQFIGDGSQLTNLPNTGGGIDIYNATSGSIPIWSDNQFLDDSPLSISQSKVSSSMPIWSNTTIYSNSTLTPTSIGRMPSGVNFDNMPVTDIIHNIMYYATPTLGFITWNNPVSSYGTSQELSSQLYLKLGDTLNEFTASVVVSNYGSFASGIDLYDGSTLISSTSQPISDGTKNIIKSNYDVVCNTATNKSYSTKAISSLQTNIIGGTRYIRWRQPIYYGYDTNTSLTQGDSISVALSGITQVFNTSTTQARSSTAAINANTNNYYYILFDNDIANLVSCKDGNNADILLLNSTSNGGTTAPSSPPQTINLYNECGLLKEYKVYRVYGIQQGPMTITIT